VVVSAVAALSLDSHPAPSCQDLSTSGLGGGGRDCEVGEMRTAVFTVLFAVLSILVLVQAIRAIRRDGS
jgi:hypothetical protein